jgi:hypothetical protein
MKRWLYRLQYKYSGCGIENLMMYITITMLAVYLAREMFAVPTFEYMSFHRGAILQGQIWRVLTFVFLPVRDNPFMVFLFLYVYYFMGRALENEWGTFSFNVFYLFGIIGAIIGGFITGFTTNYYLNMSILLAFAYLFPNMEFRIFFLIPVKVKYIGYVMWILYAIALFQAIIHLHLPNIVAILAALINFFIFFGPDIYSQYLTWQKYRGRRRQFRQSDKNHWR